MLNPSFLTLAEIIEIHKNQIETYGGSHGVRDMGLLQSAIAQPQMSFGGQWLHPDIHLMAAAYTFHLCKNHPFIDGNKRVALASGLVFLELNNTSIKDPDQKLYDAVIGIAEGKINKETFAALLLTLSK